MADVGNARKPASPPRSDRDFAEKPFVTPVEERVRRIIGAIAFFAAFVVALAFGWPPL